MALLQSGEYRIFRLVLNNTTYRYKEIETINTVVYNLFRMSEGNTTLMRCSLEKQFVFSIRIVLIGTLHQDLNSQMSMNYQSILAQNAQKRLFKTKDNVREGNS